MKISARITAIIGGYAILVMVVSAVLINYTSRGITETVVLQSEQVRVKERLEDIQRLLYERHHDVGHLVQDADFLRDPSDLHYAEREWLGVEILGKDRLVRFSSFGGARLGAEIAELKFEGAFEYTDPIIVTGVEGKVIIFRQEIVGEGEVVGQLVAYFDWEQVERLIGQDQDVEIYLLDSQYRQLATNEDEEGTAVGEWGGLEEKVRASREGAYVGLGLGGKSSIVAYVTQGDYWELPGRGWVLVFESPINTSYAISQRATVQMLLSLVFLVFMASLAIWFFITVSITNPLTQLTGLARKLAGGDLSARAKIESMDEMGELSESLNQMAEELSSTYGRLEAKVAERTQQLNVANAELEKKQLALMNVLEDVSRQKEYKEKESQSLLEIMNEAIVVTDERGQITYVNPEFERMIGYLLEEVKGKQVKEIARPFDLQDKLIDPEKLTDSEVIKPDQQALKLQWSRKDGSKIPVVRSASPIVVKNEYRGVVRILHDYTEDLAIQRQKDDFFSIASHELRTPLTVISGSLDNLLQGYGGTKFSEADHKLVVDVMSASDRLIEMVEDFLNVSRLDQGRLKLEIRPVDVCSMMSAVLAELTPMAANKGITLTAIPHTKEHGQILADEGKLREIFTNLLGNSIKFTKNGTITLTHESDGQGYLVVQIADTGIGIAADKQNNLFQRFTQVMERTLAREAGGTGLGLYISREFARLMKGELWLVKSELGKGSTFAFKIPLANPSPKSVS